MQDRMIEFISGLRAAGVRISLAESLDAAQALEHAGIADKELFRSALQATLVKDPESLLVFLKLFPLYFGSASPPPMQQPGGGGELSEQEQQMLEEMLEQMLAGMTPQQLAQLFQAMMSGQQISPEAMREMLGRIVVPAFSRTSARSPGDQQDRATRRALRQMRFDRLEQMLQALLEELRAAGMSEAALQEVEATARENMQTLGQQIGQEMGQQMLEQARAEGQQRTPINQLMDQPFEDLDEHEIEDLRGIVTRLAAQLRSRAALRQRRGKGATLDAKRTIRNNMRFAGVPMVIHQRRRHLKPKLAVICDLSYSMRPVASFMLQLIYALQDQISRTRCFAFIEDITDISTYFAESRPEQAIESVMTAVRPPYSYATDLGHSLESFLRDHCDCIDQRTTVIILGDGRNNYNDPNLRIFETIKRRARRVVWFNPEPPHMWGVFDPGSLTSDMLEYAALCDAVHYVSNLRQLVAAVDTLFVR